MLSTILQILIKLFEKCNLLWKFKDKWWKILFNGTVRGNLKKKTTFNIKYKIYKLTSIWIVLRFNTNLSLFKEIINIHTLTYNLWFKDKWLPWFIQNLIGSNINHND